MKLNKEQKRWLQINEVMIMKILNDRLEDLKEQILDCPEDKRDVLISFIKEYKLGLQIVKDINSPEKSQDFTGI
ncbi:MAG: hypothetical protein WC933_02675 [Candidatus Paceibacterota bacterium]|jgi:hypothetical protein